MQSHSIEDDKGDEPRSERVGHPIDIQHDDDDTCNDGNDPHPQGLLPMQ